MNRLPCHHTATSWKGQLWGRGRRQTERLRSDGRHCPPSLKAEASIILGSAPAPAPAVISRLRPPRHPAGSAPHNAPSPHTSPPLPRSARRPYVALRPLRSPAPLTSPSPHRAADREGERRNGERVQPPAPVCHAGPRPLASRTAPVTDLGS